MTAAQRTSTSRTEAGARLVRLRRESTRLAGRVPGSGIAVIKSAGRGRRAAAVRTQVAGTWRRLVSLPDAAIRPLAAGLAGLTMGFYLGGASRFLKVGSLGPTLVVGAVALLRRDAGVGRAT